MSKFVYIIGASGTGKDTLMNYARNGINGGAGVIFAHRYITREAFAGNENHISLSPEEFETRRRAGLFALYWESHEKRYGIGEEINRWMEKGFTVAVNGSRAYLPVARRLYPGMQVVLITARPEIISSRLAGRGRESAGEIQRRIARTTEITEPLADCLEIENNGTVEEAGETLLAVLSGRKQKPAL